MQDHETTTRTAQVTPVIWLLAAQTSVRNALARELAAGGAGPWLREAADVADLLRTMFPDAAGLVVRDRFDGYRPRLRPHKLLVEVTRPLEAGRPDVHVGTQVYVVKVGRPAPQAGEADPLEEEWRGWEHSGLHTGCDNLLSQLRRVPAEGPVIHGLVYTDAATALGGATASLEDALTDCCLHDKPTLDSVRHALRQLYDRLNHRLYRQWFLPPADAHLAEGVAADHPVRAVTADGRRRTHFRHRLDRARQALDDPANAERCRLRREVLALLAQGDDPTFLDPFAYFAQVTAGAVPVPELAVGLGHGDLHGRNVLVGLVGDGVGAVAVFDYGDLHPGNHLAWDFVKLETEFKVRLYPRLFRGPRQAWLRAVHRFEGRLAERTEAIHHNRQGPHEAPEPDAAAERLAQVLLEIRLQARRHLGRGRGRVDRWLEEYYFLLAAYGVAASRFPNLHQNEWLGVVASAGTAARRLSHPWRELPEQVAQARREARAALDSRPRASCPELVAWAAESVKGLGFGHLPGLACARTWITQAALPAQRAFVEAAAERLAALRKDYPYALEILEVQLLADLDLGRGQKAEEDLARLRRQHVELSHEVESRLGRLYKQRGEGAWDPAQAAPPEAALGAFRQALAIYRGAWVNSGHYYPGVNAAALECLLGEASARRTAEAVLAKAQPQAAVDLWAQFTVGDCQVLLGQADEAARTYRGARERGASPRDLVSVVRQLLLLRRADATVGRAWPDRHLLEVFGEAAVREAQPPTPRAAEDRGALA